jgi:FG-GAP repeat
VWSAPGILEALDAPAGSQLGTSVAISGDTIVAGAQYGGSMSQGSAYVFVRSGGVWSRQQILESAGYQFGASVAISRETVVAGAPYGGSVSQGSAYVFVRSGGVWSQQQILESVGYQFGASVAISGDTIVVGEPYGGSMSQGLAHVFVAVADAPPTITLKAPISLWPAGHDYRNVILSKMVQSASDAEDGNLINSVVVEKVTSDEPDNAPGGSDGNTSNDIVIARDCRSVRLRSERDETKNGRVYSVTLRVADSAGNVTRAVFRVSVPLVQNGAPAVEDTPPVLTVTSSCQ